MVLKVMADFSDANAPARSISAPPQVESSMLFAYPVVPT